VIRLHDIGLEVSPQTLNQFIGSWLTKANNRIHATTKCKPIERLSEERLVLLPYASIPPTQKQTKYYTNILPTVVVQTSDLREYDQLLETGVSL
jgi:hypothetical protein